LKSIVFVSYNEISGRMQKVIETEAQKTGVAKTKRRRGVMALSLSSDCN